MQLQPVEAFMYAFRFMNLPRLPGWRPTLYRACRVSQIRFHSFGFDSFACKPPVLMRFAACAYLDRNTVLKKLMLWQSTALGALPGALQTGQPLWSCTSVHMDSEE
jgi:hypothetical protein